MEDLNHGADQGHGSDPNIAARKRGQKVKQAVRSVRIVSDGVIIEFTDGVVAFFAANFLADNVSVGPNQRFLGYDPSPDGEPSPARSYPIC